MERHGLKYVSGPLHQQVASAWKKVFRYSLPNKRTGSSRLREVATAAREAVGDVVRNTRGMWRPRQAAVAS